MRHAKAFTYKPKIPGVRDGSITQTIRPKGSRPVSKGDTVTWHGWKGKPYWSKWSWRLETEITEVLNITITNEGIIYENGAFVRWKEENWLAEKDGIKPPTGEELGRLMNSHYNLAMGKQMQIIRWKTFEQTKLEVE